MQLAAKRKVIKVGSRSLAVSIPHEWVSRLGLRPGAVVSLTLCSNGAIVMKAGGEDEERDRVVVNGDERSLEELARIIVGSYIDGVDEIVITGSRSLEIASALSRSLAQRLPGILFLSDRDRLTIKVAVLDDVMDPSEAVKRMASTLELMLRYACEYVSAGKREYADKALALDDELDKMYFLILRVVNRRLALAQCLSPNVAKEIADASRMAKLLEMIGDRVGRSVKILTNCDPVPGERRVALSELYREVEDLISSSLRVYESPSAESIEEVAKRGSALLKRVAGLRDGATEATVLARVLTELEAVVEMVVDLAEMASAKLARILREESARG